MSLSVCISVYIVGFLAFPFFYSFVDDWPLASPRMDADDTLISSMLCALWPLAAFVWLITIWWCGVSWLGTSARKLCGRLMKTFCHAVEHYEPEVK